LYIKPLIAALAASTLLCVGNATAAGTLIPAANRVDMVHDAARGVIYISNGDQVLRYHVPTATFLAPIVLGGQLSGIDLSPDGATLAVADRSSDAVNEWVHLVRLSDLSASKATIVKEFMEDGLWSVAFARDGSLFASARFAGSGWVPLRRLNMATMAWSKVGAAYPDNTFTQNAMLSASGDGNTMAIAESNISDGRWGKVDVASGTLTHRTGYTDGTSWYNYEIAANANGSQYAIPTYGGTYIYNANYARVGTIGSYAGPQPIGVAYHPVEPLVYFPWSTTGQVRVYDANNLTQVNAYEFEDTFQGNGNWAFVQGRTRLSRDGSLLMVSVTGGVRVLQTYAPLSATAVTGSTMAGSPVTMGLKGAIGNGGQLSYAISSAPAKGSAIVNGNLVTYTPAPGTSGTDTFGYVVQYGSARAASTVTVSVTQANRAPLAVNDVVSVPRNSSVTISVLANDSDADGDPLSITTVSKPANGMTAISFNKVIFTPAPHFFGPTSFTYSISDGKGGSASARVDVNVTK
jgi:hypothetical protein